jgi:ASC-1-like (ASCH) protein
MIRVKTLWIREKYLHQILSGRKTVEIRVGYPNIIRLTPGDILLLNEKYPYMIAAIRQYPNFETMVAAETPADIAPDITNRADLLEACRRLYSPEKEKLGVIALQISPAARTLDAP